MADQQRHTATTRHQAAQASLADRLLAVMTILGNGFLSHTANAALRQDLATGKLSVTAYYRQIRCLVYRFLWLAIAEQRGLLFTAAATAAMRQRYQRSYALASLCRQPRRHEQDGQRYQRLTLVMAQLSGHDATIPLGLPVLQWSLWAPAATRDLTACLLPDQTLSAALQTLLEQIPQVVGPDGVLAAAALAQLYRRLATLSPQIKGESQPFQLTCLQTPQTAARPALPVTPDLLALLLERTLSPLLQQAMAQSNAADALLALKICDPCCGAGDVLLAAAQRIAQCLVQVRTGTAAPQAADLHTALYEVLRSCCYGVTPCALAVEICQLTLALASMAAGQSLAFLDQRICRGSPGLSAPPDFLERGIPEAALVCLPGDQRRLTTALQQRNRQAHSGQLALPFAPPPPQAPQASSTLASTERGTNLPVSLLADAWCAAFVWPKTLTAPPAMTQELFWQLRTRPEQVPTTVYAEITRLAQQYGFFHYALAFPEVFRDPQHHGFDVILGAWPWAPLTFSKRAWLTTHAPLLPPGLPTSLPQQLKALAQTAPELYHTFLQAHRQATGTMHLLKALGFATLAEAGAWAQAALLLTWSQRLVHRQGRVGCIVASGRLLTETTLCQEWLTQGALDCLYVAAPNRRQAFTWSPAAMQCVLTLRGTSSPQHPADVVWAIDQHHSIDQPQRHVPLRMDDVTLLNPTTQALPMFRQTRDAELARAIYQRVPTLHAPGVSADTSWALQATPLWASPRRLPQFLTRQQLEAEGWRLEGNRFRHGTETYLPVYQGSMFQAFDQRWGSYSGASQTLLPAASKHSPDSVALPRFWVAAQQVMQATAHVPAQLLEAYQQRKIDAVVQALAQWFAGHAILHGHTTVQRETLARAYHPVLQTLPHNFTASSDTVELATVFPLSNRDLLLIKRQPDALALARTLIAEHCPAWLLVWSSALHPRAARLVHVSILPRVGLEPTCYWLRLPTADARLAGCLLANLSSLVVDFSVQHKLRKPSLTVADFLQLPVLPPHRYDLPCAWSPRERVQDWLMPRVLELLYTSWELAPFAQDCGYTGPPFRWDDNRRLLLQSEIEAAYAVLYGLTRDDVQHLVTVWQQRQTTQGEALEQQAQLVVQLYDALQQASTTGTDYVTQLDPPPSHVLLAHPARQTALTPHVPFRYVTPTERSKFKTCVPLLTLATVVAAFAEAQTSEPETWVELLNSRPLRPGMFVAQVTGQAMHPVIPDGAYCLFEHHMSGDSRRLHGRIVLAYSPTLEDPETGENFTVRRYHWLQTPGRATSTRRPSIQLLPIDEAFAPLSLTHNAQERHVIAAFLSVLEALPS